MSLVEEYYSQGSLLFDEPNEADPYASLHKNMKLFHWVGNLSCGCISNVAEEPRLKRIVSLVDSGKRPNTYEGGVVDQLLQSWVT